MKSGAGYESGYEFSGPEIMNENLDRLIKLLRMTTSSNDSEALLAIRAANRQLSTINTDWEKLIRGKVTVLADPFIGVAEPPKPAPKPAPKPSAPPSSTYSPQRNFSSGRCYCCGFDVKAADGWYHYIKHNHEIVCDPCTAKITLNGSSAIPSRRARHRSNITLDQLLANM